MEELHFTIPVSGIINVDNGTITISVNKADTTLYFTAPVKEKRISLPKGETLSSLVLAAARALAGESGTGQFSAAELYHKARERHPTLKRNSFASQVIACTPNHPSYKYYETQRDYLVYSGKGQYRLNAAYASNQSPVKVRMLNQ
jgi:hypothetical protein